LARFSWIALVVALVCGVAGALFLRHRLEEAVERFEADTAGDATG
jgi:hypothetical protein